MLSSTTHIMITTTLPLPLLLITFSYHDVVLTSVHNSLTIHFIILHMTTLFFIFDIKINY